MNELTRYSFYANQEVASYNPSTIYLLVGIFRIWKEIDQIRKLKEENKLIIEILHETFCESSQRIAEAESCQTIIVA